MYCQVISLRTLLDTNSLICSLPPNTLLHENKYFLLTISVTRQNYTFFHYSRAKEGYSFNKDNQ